MRNFSIKVILNIPHSLLMLKWAYKGLIKGLIVPEEWVENCQEKKSKQGILEDLNFQIAYKHNTWGNSKLWKIIGRTFNGQIDKNKLMKGVNGRFFPSSFSISPRRRIMFHIPSIFSLLMSVSLTSKRSKVVIVTSIKILKISTLYIFFLFVVYCMYV